MAVMQLLWLLQGRRSFTEHARACALLLLLYTKTRSARDNKVWELCLTPTALEGTGNNNKALLLRLGDIIGAKATPATVNSVVQDGAWGEGADNEKFVHRLEVFAYVPGGNATERTTGCAASGG